MHLRLNCRSGCAAGCSGIAQVLFQAGVGWWGDPVPLAPVDLGEVAAVHQVPVASLLDPAHRETWVHPGGFSGPAFLLGDLYIWGFTAYLLDGMFDLLGWTQPWDTSRTSEIPPRFLSERL